MQTVQKEIQDNVVPSSYVKDQRDYFLSGKTLPYDFRLEALKKLRASIVSHGDDIEAALSKEHGDIGRTNDDMRILGILGSIDHALTSLSEWMLEKKISTPKYGKDTYAYSVAQAKGVVLLIGAWNVPFYSTLIPLVGAIAAGNCCMIKPSEVAVHSAAVVASIIQSCFDPAYISVVQGSKQCVHNLLTKRFDHVHFVGSSQAGRDVYVRAAKHLTPVSLQLGGKNPCIVDKNVDLKAVAKRIILNKFYNAGQECVAPDFILANESIAKKLIASLKEYINHYYGDIVHHNKKYDGRIIDKAHYLRLCELAHLPMPHIEKDEDLIFPPTILPEVTWHDDIMQTEIFGPILPVLTYTKIEDVIKKLQQRDSPLALYLFTQNKAIAQQVFQHVSFGGGCINDLIVHASVLPLGGVGYSGIGKSYKGEADFNTFSYQKNVFVREELNDALPIQLPWKLKTDVY